MTGLTAPRRLIRSDDRRSFRSGAADLDDWFHRYAWQNQLANNAVTYVLTDGDRIAGFYSLAMAAVSKDAAPQALARHRPSQIPCILLARLAVDASYHGQGLGWELLRDALLRAVQLSRSIGAAAVLVHCRDDAARAFYLHNGDFLSSPVDDLHLMVPIAALEKFVD
ncbi:GNAT family N-acetyltransferase [Microbacterium luticocti]|uniref:GNAT family N-acetyltransferase n=1 Tax=Microbacterium luticocti TaxID=451764 RepID=UPI000415CC0C|nr:GNAT family N-acetyltransferase [Microbacterium luticocti]